jgi:hypothetical protein
MESGIDLVNRFVDFSIAFIIKNNPFRRNFLFFFDGANSTDCLVGATVLNFLAWLPSTADMPSKIFEFFFPPNGSAFSFRILLF